MMTSAPVSSPSGLVGIIVYLVGGRYLSPAGIVVCSCRALSP